MKRLLLPLILVILITAVVFVSCAKEDPTPTTEPETVTEEENTPETSTSSTTKKPIPTFKTAPAQSTTEFKGTPVIYPTTSTTTKAATTTTAKASTTTLPTSSSKTPTPEVEKPGDKDYDNPDEIMGDVNPLISADQTGNADVTEIGKLTLIKWLG